MLDLKVTVANDDLDRVEDWIEDTQAALTEDMIASKPTRKTDAATTVFVMLEHMRAQIRDFKLLLAEKEAAARR